MLLLDWVEPLLIWTLHVELLGVVTIVSATQRLGAAHSRAATLARNL